MTFPVAQPTLPPEGPYSDAELLFLSEEPKRLFPQNQNSNFGLLRKVLTSEPQVVIDILTDLYAQMFIGTATGVDGYLGRYESQYGLPKAPTGYSDARRRVWIGIRKKLGLFSVSRIKEIVESFLTFTTGGISTQLLPGGVAITAGGITLYGEGGSVSSQYRVYFDPRNYTYNVWIQSSITPDIISMTRMLNILTPAGVTVVVDNAHSVIVDYGRTVLNRQPSGFYRLADFTDSSGYANNGTSFGTISAVTSPGLLTSGKNDDQAAKLFDGTTGYFTVPDQSYIDFGDIFSIAFWIKPTTITGTQVIVDKGANGYMVRENAGVLELQQSGVGLISAANVSLAAGTTYFCVVRKSGTQVKWSINTVDRTGTITQRTIADTTSALFVGRLAASSTNFLNAALDELALFPYWLSDAQILEIYNAGKNINP